VERCRAELEADTDHEEHHAEGQQRGVRVIRRERTDRVDLGEVQRAGRAVDHRHAI
jgi:hypothetical protein